MNLLIPALMLPRFLYFSIAFETGSFMLFALHISPLTVMLRFFTASFFTMKFWAWQWNISLSRSSHGDTGRRFENDKKKPGENYFRVSLDLTKRRYNLLKIAQGIVKEMDNVSFVCTDVNCPLAIHFKNDTIKHFNSEYEFHPLLNDN